jgi:glyoxylase-like metal-dependent hydrolase (beta-lactamase superfamily II)
MPAMEVLPGLFMIKVPLPGNPLKTLNSYIIKAEKSLVIDTGFNMEVCYTELIKALNEIGVDFKRAEYFITHLHADHLGLAGRLTSRVYMSGVDIEIRQKFAGFRSDILRFFTMNGFPQEDTERITRLHPAVRYSSSIDFQPVKDGEILECGDYALKAMLTPGHTPGHMCLYDEERKILFSGDHILFDITPNISYWEGHDSLREYLNSLDKIYKLDIDRTFPGHRGFHGEVKKRILELKEHHRKRLEEIVNALKGGARNAWQISPHITWDITYSNWDELPTVQKWFIINETIAHLIYLENNGIVAKEIKNGNVYYKLVK